MFFLAFANVVHAQKILPKPNPAKLFVDYGNLVHDNYDEQLIEKKLVELDDSTGNQICVVTVKNLNGEEIDDVTYNTFNDWKIGNAKNDNGILLLISLEDRKVRIEVGKGLEGAIPDIIASRIIRQDIVPAFKQKNYLGGINAAIDHLSQAAAGEYHNARKINKGSNGKAIGSGLGFLIFIIIMIVIIISNRGGGGGNGYRRNNSWIIPLLFNSGGWSGNSGGWGGGGSAGGFGGFGGFGGGSSGGGGASGSW